MTKQVGKNQERGRYELYVDDQLVGIADYAVQGDSVVFPHTEVTPPMRGQGLGEVLVQAALEDVRSEGMAVVPRCWFVAQFIDENPEFKDLVAAQPLEASPASTAWTASVASGVMSPPR